ncbi:hypothetical protein M758_12G093800 [Ceratodon purpureus]|nr:hypothetical protein M758_12G093800 [Ceratodon purpureus]
MGNLERKQRTQGMPTEYHITIKPLPNLQYSSNPRNNNNNNNNPKAPVLVLESAHLTVSLDNELNNMDSEKEGLDQID